MTLRQTRTKLFKRKQEHFFLAVKQPQLETNQTN